jgi:nitrogen regulatory protein PII-like uncharacterized protein
MPTMAAFFYICEYLGISPQEFFEFDSKNPKKLDELIGYMKSLTTHNLTI